MEDAYEGIADRYDLFHGSIDQHDDEEIAFFAWLIKTFHPEHVLDCACGTGPHLHLLSMLGCQVTGSDLSAAMLEQARVNLDRLGLHVRLHKADYRELPKHFEREFDAVMCLTSSFLHMPDEASALAALQSMRAVLRPGGIVVLTQGTSDYQWQHKPRFLLAQDNQDVTRLFVIDYVGEGARYNILDVLHGQNEALQVWSTEFPRVYLQDDYQRLMDEAGFGNVTFFGSWGRGSYTKDRPGRLIVLGQTE